MNVSFEKDLSKEKAKVIVVPVANGNNWGLRSRNLNMEFGCALSGRIEGKPSFEGKTGQILTGTVATTSGFKDIIFLGIGNPEALEQKSFKGLGATLFCKKGAVLRPRNFRLSINNQHLHSFEVVFCEQN